MDLAAFVTDLGRATPGLLKSVVLFGSRAAGEDEGNPPYDLLCVFERLGLAEMEAISGPVAAWCAGGQPLPLMFTVQQLETSTDAFAIEFADMQHRHRVLYGEDVIARLRLDARLVRVHLERELKGKALALRDRYVLSAGTGESPADLMRDSISTILILFRAALRLLADDAPFDKMQAAERLSALLKFDVRPCALAYDLRQGRRASGVNWRSAFGDYLVAIDRVTDAVDRLRVPHEV